MTSFALRHSTHAPARERSSLAFRAAAVMPGGVSSPARALSAVGDAPLFVTAAAGAFVVTSEGEHLLDYVGGWGAGILGHAPATVVRAVQHAAAEGLGVGLTTPVEIELAERIVDALPGMDQVRFTCSGTEAVMSAVRLARIVTGRRVVVRFAGGYHGHSDAVLASDRRARGTEAAESAESAQAPAETRGAAVALGDAVVLPYNDSAALRDWFSRNGTEVACAIVEPVSANMGLVPASSDFLGTLRECATQAGALLIADEVVTGFRLTNGSTATQLGCAPDLITLGKIIGGALPVGAFAGPARLMRHVAPCGEAFHAGTQAGNRLGMIAGLATLRELSPALYDQLDSLGAELQTGLEQALAEAEVAGCVQRAGSMLTLFIGPAAVRNANDLERTNASAFARFFRGMRDRGVLIPPSQAECWFLSVAHARDDIRRTVGAAREALRALATAGSPDGGW